MLSAVLILSDEPDKLVITEFLCFIVVEVEGVIVSLKGLPRA